MKPQRFKFAKSHFQQIITILSAACISATAFSLAYSRPLYKIDETVTGFIYSNNPFEKADSRITILALDEDFINTYGDFSKGSRDVLANVINQLSKEEASILGLSVDLTNTTNDEDDAALVDACANLGNVVVATGANINFRQENIDPSKEWASHEVNSVTQPYDALNNVVTTGINNTLQASVDGFIRSTGLSITFKDQTYDSFSLALYKAYQNKTGQEISIPDLDDTSLFEFNNIYDIKSYQIISLSDYLNGDYKESYIKDHIVLVGPYVDNTNYNAFTHFSATRNQQPILMYSSILQALLTQRTIVTVDYRIMAWVFAILFFLFHYMFSQKRKKIMALIQTLVIFLGTFICYSLNLAGYRILLLVPIICFFMSVSFYLLQLLLFNTLEKRQMKHTLSMYVGQSVVDEISDIAPFALNTLTERKNVAVLFVDIRGFTTLSEEMDPGEVVDILNQYFSVVYASITAWNGTVDKFIGDAAMALFNAPKEDENYVLHAACAAMDIIEGFDDLKNRLYEQYHKEINVGIGVNCGEAIVGNIGCLGRVDYTAIGDVVNTASRLESKAAPRQILISESVATQIDEYATLTSIGELTLKGKTKTIHAYQIDTINKPAEPNALARKEFLRETALLYSKALSNRQLPELFKEV